MFPVLKSQDIKLQSIFQAYLTSHLTTQLFPLARGVKYKPLGGAELSFPLNSQQCHAHSINLHAVNWTVADLGRPL